MAAAPPAAASASTPARGTPPPAASPAAPGPFVRGTPLPSPAPAAPGPFVRGTPLPAPAPERPRRGTPLPSTAAAAPGPFVRGTPLPAPAPSAPEPSARGTPLPAEAPPAPSVPPPPPIAALVAPPPSAESPVPLPSGPRAPPGSTPLPRAVPPGPSDAVTAPAAVAPAALSAAASDDWWTDGVTTPAPPPKDAWEVGRARPTTLAPSAATEGDALNLVAPLPVSAGGTPLPAKMPTDPKQEARLLLQRASELQELDDHSGARELLLQAQALDPETPEVARALAESEQTLQAAYESKLGKLSTVPKVRLREDEVIWLNLDHRAGFILAQIDGSLTFDDLFSVSGMSRLDTARILVELLEQRVIVR